MESWVILAIFESFWFCPKKCLPWQCLSPLFSRTLPIWPDTHTRLFLHFDIVYWHVDAKPYKTYHMMWSRWLETVNFSNTEIRVIGTQFMTKQILPAAGFLVEHVKEAWRLVCKEFKFWVKPCIIMFCHLRNISNKLISKILLTLKDIETIIHMFISSHLDHYNRLSTRASGLCKTCSTTNYNISHMQILVF